MKDFEENKHLVGLKINGNKTKSIWINISDGKFELNGKEIEDSVKKFRVYKKLNMGHLVEKIFVQANC